MKTTNKNKVVYHTVKEKILRVVKDLQQAKRYEEAFEENKACKSFKRYERIRKATAFKKIVRKHAL